MEPETSLYSNSQALNPAEYASLDDISKAQLFLAYLNMIFMNETMLAPQIPGLENSQEDESEETDSVTFTCCQMNFLGKRGLNQHIGKQHSQSEKTIICGQCGKTYKHKNALNFHVKQVHERATRVRCLKCGKLVYNKYMLKNHMKKHHPAITHIG